MRSNGLKPNEVFSVCAYELSLGRKNTMAVRRNHLPHIRNHYITKKQKTKRERECVEKRLWKKKNLGRRKQHKRK